MTTTIAAKILLASIPILVSLYTKKWKELDELNGLAPDDPQNLNLPTKETYDFVIVGGGTAGCILATRLSEKFSVLVLEAGPRPPPLVDVPRLTTAIDTLPEINFLFRSTPQRNAGREKNGVITVLSGKMLGGSGSHNHAAWERGNPRDYNQWASVVRDEGWKYKNLKKYFKKIERHYPGQRPTNKEQSGHIDLIESSLSHTADPWLEAGKELGYKIRDPMKPQSVGFNKIIFGSLNGSRGSTYKAYLKPAMKKRQRRLRVLTFSFVSRIIIEKNRAVGVEYERHGVARAAFAGKEIIVCAGAMVSPLILFKSGIGPKDQVEAAKAPKQIINLPVGKNLQDHALLTAPPILVNDSKLSWTLRQNLTFEDIRDFIKKRKGPLTTAYEGGDAFIVINKNGSVQQQEQSNFFRHDDENDWPNMQIVYEVFEGEPGTVSSNIFCSRPLSRGVLKINASATGMDDNYLPLINYNYYDNPIDLDIMVEGINFFLRVIEETKAFKKVGARLSPSHYGPCKTHKFRSIEYWKCFIRHKTTAGLHAVGTCRMGHGKTDPEAVVDSKLRVIGVKGLRVADASIFPFVTNANIYASVMVVAEKAADEILKAHRGGSSFVQK